ncbi:MAG: hypothetical protein LW806_04325 [Planctomycetaceae bacterium]|nr:hypothetical protein [Planctomycetaceae bacterium]
MVSHTCERCGAQLDRSTRTYAPSIRMWVATCPRCGSAARWNLRRARMPSWVWARTRAINIRLGVALATGQFAGLLSCPYAAIIGEESSQFATLGSGGVTDTDLLAFVFILGSIIALFAAISAVMMAPHRGLLTRLACAWILAALPVPLVLLCMALPVQWEEAWFFLRSLQSSIGLAPYLGLLAVPVVLSAILAAILGPIVGAGRRAILRRHARAQTERLRGLRRADSAAQPAVPHAHH